MEMFVKRFGSIFDSRNEMVYLEGIDWYVKRGFGYLPEVFGLEGLDSVYIWVFGWTPEPQGRIGFKSTFEGVLRDMFGREEETKLALPIVLIVVVGVWPTAIKV